MVLIVIDSFGDRKFIFLLSLFLSIKFLPSRNNLTLLIGSFYLPVINLDHLVPGVPQKTFAEIDFFVMKLDHKIMEKPLCSQCQMLLIDDLKQFQISLLACRKGLETNA